MKNIFEEYGRTIVLVVAVVCVLALLLVRSDFFHVLGTVADVDSGISHSGGSGALGSAVSREKPMGDFSGVESRILSNFAFQPLKGVVFTDAEGDACEVSVMSIRYYCASTGTVTEMKGHYNRDGDFIILNPGHYPSETATCSVSEFTPTAAGKLEIVDDSVRNLPGAVTVTYRAVDGDNQVTIAKYSFVVDSKEG